MPDLAPETLHNDLLTRAPRILGFDPEAYFPEWQSAVRRSFKQLLGLMPAKAPLGLQLVSDSQQTSPLPHREIRFLFTSESRVDIPATLVLPTSQNQKPPVIICLQSHEIAAHGSLGKFHNDCERQFVEVGHDFAIQAFKQNYAAIVFDQRAMGERADARPDADRRGNPKGCRHAALNALLVGRTLLGERVWDVTRAVDALTEYFGDHIDTNRIGIMGFSAGGAVAYYAAALDSRLAAVAASGAVCTYGASLSIVDRCECNYLPNILHYFDMADLAGLISPRPLLISSGESDMLNPAHAVHDSFAEIKSIYRAAGNENACRLRLVPGGHRPFPELWHDFQELTSWRS